LVVNTSANDGLHSAAEQAQRAIHDNNLDRLKQLVIDEPGLLTWTGNARGENQEWGDGGVLGFATAAYGDVFEPKREKDFTRAECAAWLIDAGAVVMPAVLEGLLASRARGLLQLFHRKRLLPPTLRFLAALGELDAVKKGLAAADAQEINSAFMIAGRFKHEAIASLLLERAITLDSELAGHVEEVGRAAFVKHFIDNGADLTTSDPWRAFVKGRIDMAMRDDDFAAFINGFQRAPWLLGESEIPFQLHAIEQLAFHGRGAFITALFDLQPALLRQPAPATKAFEHALTYAHTDVVRLLTRLWPMPDDLPHHAGMGHLPRVKELLAASDAPPQRELDVALAYAVINRHFEIADLLLEHGADINTNWNSHEPASILHHLVFEDNYESMQYLIDRGIDMSIKDYRWHATAEGWARHGKNDPAMAEWLRSRLYTK
jgi:hypothetical protein